ncbi:LysM peptidoglycan-binding domain-containing protein [Erythrobacter sp. R86502]|uniref:LysM peptidoglycan-binding domain-containing protein n=1 Tax=Erythrobacter sp. R86502 TaxID=3093846 RepID=UPI0036D209FC
MTSRYCVAVIAAVLLAACSGKAPVQMAGTNATATATGDVDAIANLLYIGKRKEASKRLDKALNRDPGNPALMMLRQSIIGNAREDMGPVNFPYVVQNDDTMTSIAEQFLGNRLKAYQLARYNNIDNPHLVTAGTVLQIPGQPPRAAPPPRTVQPSTTRAPTQAPATARTPVKAKAPAGVRTDPAAAKRAHAAGLAALNQGRLSQAMSQLGRAAALDPGNAAINRDLARAKRIAATVRARN